MDFVYVFARNWWSIALRGVVAILLGLLTLFWPGITLRALVLLFGAYALIDGIVSIIGAWRAAEARDRWGMLLLEGLAGIAAAAITIMFPAITAVALVYLIAAWALITGVLEVAAAVRLRQYISHEWLLALSGIVSILFGILLFVAPIAGAFVIALWIGIYALVFGVVLIALAFRLRSWGRTTTPSAAL
jgi:uncharacterized membrane protein HdeD (DUF308 family)